MAHVVFAVDAVLEKKAETLEAKQKYNLAAQATTGRVYVPVNLSNQNNLVLEFPVNAEILGKLFVATGVPVLDIDVAVLLRLVQNNQRIYRSIGYLVEIILAALVLGAVLVNLAQMLKAVVMEQRINIVGGEAGFALGKEIKRYPGEIHAGYVMVNMATLRQGSQNMILESYQTLAAALVTKNKGNH
jgi:hypothetical protein